MFIILFTLAVMWVSWITYGQLVWSWHETKDGSDGVWPWYIRWEHRNVLKQLPRDQQFEFLREMHHRIRYR
jgi:hypothetical protein